VTDEELWRFLGDTPISPRDAARNRYPYDPRQWEGLSDDPADGFGYGRQWIDEAKAFVKSAEVSPDGQVAPEHAPVYLCRVLYLLEGFHTDPLGTPAATRDFLSGAFWGGLVYSGYPSTRYDPSIFDRAFDMERGKYIRVGEQKKGESECQAFWDTYVYLMPAGRDLVAKAEASVLTVTRQHPSDSGPWSKPIPKKDLQVALGICANTLKRRLTTSPTPIAGLIRYRGMENARKIECVITDLPDAIRVKLRHYL
jgi:hypothetical protein